MIRHASWIRNRFKVKSDGKTAYERWKGKKFRADIVEFGERVMYLKPGSRGKNKLECRWSIGIWLGMRDESQESIIGTPDRCLKVKDIRRLGSDADRWNAEEFNEFKGLPWEPVPGSNTMKIKVNVHVPRREGCLDDPVQGEPKGYAPKRFRITKKDFDSIGFTPLCPGCRAILRNLPAQNHSELCRSRVEAELIRKGDQRVENAHARFKVHEEEHSKSAPGVKRSGEAQAEEEKAFKEHRQKKEDETRGVKRDACEDAREDDKRVKENESQGEKRDREEEAGGTKRDR